MSEEQTVTKQDVKNNPLYKKGWKDAKADRSEVTGLLFMSVTIMAGIVWVMFFLLTYSWIGETEYERGVKETQVEAVERGVAEWRVDNVRGGTALWWLTPEGDVKFNTELPQETNVVSPGTRPITPATE